MDPWVGKIPWRKEQATHSSILAWRIPWTVCIVHGVTKSQTQLSDFDFVFTVPNSSVVWGSKCLEDFLKPSITITSHVLPFRSRTWDRRSIAHREGND